ncbi:MAG: hypothetical protein A2741_02005 [Candidatus Zambryskibacteria bacterium RIFCSPHIGHO2_01_FULL_43_27]|uniref:CYTH domain-containing protein n=1 Tax=Candidatus Zambryskibacteria bacterium RIFCSPLOWO2_01_FULL_43_17 TaxID=1802760 RepID=A0A1G2U114_9BACT|nr:MAG: hypothetical protein A2741_02005 [Candidatus Zambryskibacteria bacterium RIFCSPHIGHO2_01_FULL_43_27]OHB03211.1 MAG: hypothetical protein A2920_02490 [Candidatus Zambryskibacteria bacterium RIFCSPLOWO2_01_FULL_43_17]
MQREIEIKLKVNDFNKIIEEFTKLGCKFTEPIIQKDIIFVDESYGDFAKHQQGKNVLRIRQSSEKYLFTLKQSQDNELDSIEREVEISDPKIFREALELMGYKEMVRVNKIRRKAKYRDYEICLDRVEELGTFIELEKFSDGDGAGVQNEMLQFLQNMGIDTTERVERGYDTLMWLKEHPTS